MTASGGNERVADFVDRYVAFLADDGDEPDWDELPESLREEARRRLGVLDALEADVYPVPPIEDDPIARRFGFGRASATISISATALKDALNSASLRISDVAERLTAAGRPTGTAEVFRLVNQGTTSVDRDLAARLAAILDMSVEMLEVTSRGVPRLTFDEFLVTEEARHIIDDYTQELGLGLEALGRRAKDLIGATAFRNQTEEAWADALRAALERIRHEHGS